jgi:trans-aconitate methyltransferase
VSADRFGIEGYNASTYGDSFADVYDEWYSHLADDDFPRYLARLLPDRPAKVLELGVGTGRLLRHLRALRGNRDEFTGIDSSQAMLDKLQEHHDLRDVRVEIGDFSQQLPEGLFDLVFVGYNTLFNLPDDDALSSCLSLVRTRLNTDGVFAIDVVIPESESSPDVVSVKSITTESVTLSVSRHDHTVQRIVGQFVEISSGSGVTMRPWSVRYWTPAQLDTLATAAGLSLHARVAHGDADGDSVADGSDDARHITTYVRT